MQPAKGEPGAPRRAEAVATKADSTHVTDPATAGQPAAGQPTAGKPTAGKPTAGKPASGKLTAGKPTAGQSAAGKPTAGQSAAGKPAAGLPASGRFEAEPLAAGTSTVDGFAAGGSAGSGAAFDVTRLPTPRRHPPVVSRVDLFGAISLASLVSLTGLPIAWLWSRFAPAQLSIMQEDGSSAALPIESQHRFDDLATFVILSAMVGLLVGAAAWLMRGRRGPLAVVGLAAGSLFAAWLAVRMGVSLGQTRYAQPHSLPDAVVAVAPRIESHWVIVIQPLFAVLAYGIAAAASGLEDLGRRLT
jgi:hypothetical protein